jgi:hypothetical protein
VKPRTPEAAVAAGAVLFALAFSYPVLAHLKRIGAVVPFGPGAFYDWDFHEQLQWVPFFTVRHFHQFPFWNPYKCGGLPMFANPQSQILTPFFLLHLLLGPFVAYNLSIPLHIAIGWSGGYVLARVLGMREAAGVVCGSIFMGSSWLYLHTAIGHVIFLTAAYMPWILACMWRSFESLKLFPAALAGFLIALILGEGGIHQISQVFLVVGLLAFALCISERTFWPIATLVVLGAFAAGFAAIKLIPAYEMIKAYPRIWTRPETNTLRILAMAIFSRHQVLERPRVMDWWFWEYGAYLSPIAATLAALGVASSGRRAMPWLVAAVVLFTLAMGTGGIRYPWVLLHKLPIFSSERAAGRMLIPFTLAIAVLAAMGAEFLQHRATRRGMTIIWIVIAAMVLDFWTVSVPTLRHAVEEDRPQPPIAPTFRQYRNESPLVTLAATMANQGSLNCYEYTAVRTDAVGVNQPGYFGEQYLLGAGTVRLTRWSPDALSFKIDAPMPTTMIVNQNYNPSWRLTQGHGNVFASGGLLAVSVPEGLQTITLEYGENMLMLGAIISILTILAAITLWFLERTEGETKRPV